ncbi:MAG: YfcE family phosphodiesterase [Candidatus Nanohaloarchaea archaeon]
MIAILSDSHIPGRAEKIPEKFWEKVEEADVTVHAGDYARKETFNAVEEYSKEFYGVKGNCDFFETDELENSQRFERKGLSFGVYHGTGVTPRGHTPTLQKIASEDLEVEVLIHGHTHRQQIVLGEKALLLNPGSCTGAGGGASRESAPTMMTVDLGEKLEASILKIEGGELKLEESKSFELKEIKKDSV